MKLRLITWNVHGLPPPARFGGSDRMRRIADEVCRRAPDVVAFQEVWRGSFVRLISTQLAAAGYASAGCGIGGRSTGGLLTFYQNSRWSLSVCEFVKFLRYASKWRFWEGDGLSGKGFLASVLISNADRREVAILNTHLQSQYGRRTYVAIRRSQLQQIDDAATRMGTRRPAILAGDLNTFPSEPLFGETSRSWIDLTEPFRRDCELQRVGCGTHLTGNAEDEWVDYVFARRTSHAIAAKGVELIRNQKRDVPFSDHDGIQVDLHIDSGSEESLLARRLLRLTFDSSPMSRRESLAFRLGRRQP